MPRGDDALTPAGGGAGTLIPSVSIAHLVQQRDAIAERVTQAAALLAEADAIAKASAIEGPSSVLANMCYHRRTLTDDPAKVIAGVDAQAWRLLLEQTGLRSFMDAKSREAWDSQVRECKTPALTADAVEATFTALYEARGDMFERGVIALFRRLSWDYKTNQPARFGKRLIVTGLRRYGYIDYTGCNELDDLTRALCILDGVPEPDHRCAMESTLRALDMQGERQWAGPYFRIRWFANGNGHLTFVRLDLIDALNAILAKHYPGALPCAVQRARR